MMKRLPLLTCALLVFLAGVPLYAQDTGGMVITSVWARPTGIKEMSDMGEATAEPMGSMNMGHAVGNGTVSAAYMQIANQTGETVRLVAAVSTVATVTEIHEVSMVDNVMQMRPVDGGIEIPAGESVELRPGGYHVMLIDLVRDLYAGDALAVTLTFALADGTTQAIIVGAAIQDEAPAATPLQITQVWARPTGVKETSGMGEATVEPMGNMNMGDGAVSAAYMFIQNTGDTTDKLVAARTDVAGLVEIHQVTMMNDVMQMRPVDGGIEIPPGETVELRPGGYHVMLMDLNQDLYTDEAISLTLVFESGLELTVGVPVIEPQ
jgi:copper(I)-binding protein